jgi:hypothetical protein
VIADITIGPRQIIAQADAQAEIAQAEREIECGGRLAHPALARRHRDDGGNTWNFGLSGHRRGRRALRRAVRRNRLHARRM